VDLSVKDICTISIQHPFALANIPDISKGRWISSNKILDKSLLGFFKIEANHLGLLGFLVKGTCANGQTLQYQVSNSTWVCATVSSGVPSVNSFTSPINIVGQAGNTTITNSSGTITVGVGSNIITAGGAAQTISKQMTFGNNVNMGGNITSTAIKEFKITAPAGIPICIGTGC
jgi:hypothetical protein